MCENINDFLNFLLDFRLRVFAKVVFKLLVEVFIEILSSSALANESIKAFCNCTLHIIISIKRVVMKLENLSSEHDKVWNSILLFLLLVDDLRALRYDILFDIVLEGFKRVLSELEQIKHEF